MTGKQIVILIVVIIAIIILLNMFVKKKTTTNISSSNNSVPNVGLGNIINNLPLVGFPLKKGSVGSNVSTLQTYLNSKGANLSVDGVFGNLTLAALQQYTGLSEVSEQYFNTYILNSGGSNTSTSSTSTDSNTGIVIGTKFYAKANNTNSYNSTDINSNNIAYYNYSKDEYVGDFVRSENFGTIYVLVNNDNNTVYVLASQVYSK